VFDNLRLGVRALVYLRDIAKSLRVLAAIAEREYPARHATKPRPTEIGELDVAEVDRRWRASIAAYEEGVDLPDEPPPDDKAPS
jgi:hypothetical protein